MIKAVGLTKKFGAFTALDALHTEIDRGRVYGLVGPNGSGKSTFLRSIAGIYRPDAGTLTVDGHAVFDTPAVKDRIFLLAEDLFFLPKSTVDDMAAFYAGLYSGFSRERYQQLKARFPIRTDRRISTFSKGMKRQAALLLALASGTDYLLLDEAFDGLDPTMRIIVKRMIVDAMLDRNLTTIISSHNLKEINEVCDTVALLHEGKIVFSRELDSVKSSIHKLQVVPGAGQLLDADRAKALGVNVMHFEQSSSVYYIIAKGTEEELRQCLAPIDPMVLDVIPLTLEEIFIYELEVLGYDSNTITE